MLSWVKARWRLVVAASAVIALVAGVGIWSAVQLNTTPPAAVDCSTLEAETFNEAAPLADACDADVEVLAERTPWQTSFATSAKTSRLEVTTLPSRVQVDGKWTAPDDSLVKDEKAGTIKVAAPVFPMELNAGGAAGKGKPLGSITSGGHRLDVWFPLELPEPKLKDSRAIYQLAKGTRLIVTVNQDTTGFLPVVELANPDAAARFAAMLDAAPHSASSAAGAMTLEFATAISDGLRLTMDDANSVHVVNDRDETQFLAPSPMMWDSSGTEMLQTATNTQDASTDRTQAPAGGDQIAWMPVRLDDKVIVVSPDTAMLHSKETEWPVYIDPGFSGQGSTKRVLVRTSSNSNFNSTLVGWVDAGTGYPGQGTGYCSSTSYGCGAVYYQRLAWQFTGMSVLDDLTSAEISAAKFKVYGQHSFSCSDYTTTLYRTSDIGGYQSEPNYNNLQMLEAQGSLATHHSTSCGGQGYKEFDAVIAARWAATNNMTTLNLGLVVDQSSMNAWKRYLYDASLSVDYNRTPTVPTSLSITSPIASCASDAARPVIASTTPTLAATSTDPDGTSVATRFVVVDQATLSTVKWDSGYPAAIASGNKAQAAVPSTAGLATGQIYAWRTKSSDGALESAWSSWCEFEVDTVKPAVPTVTAVSATNDPSVQAVYVENASLGGPGQSGKFRLSRGSSTDVVAFTYGFNGAAMTAVTLDGTGQATITYTPAITGRVTLTVLSQDRAGNSTSRQYKFTVATPREDGIWAFDEGIGTTAYDSVPMGNSAKLSSSSDWGTGPHDLFGSRPGDKALKLPGTPNHAAATTAPVVDTTKSFVVSAHVYLNPGTTGIAGKSYVALSQDGVYLSGFRLGYVYSCTGMTGGCWEFSMPNTPTSGKTVVRSTVPVTTGEWVYLVGQQNIVTHTLDLWVCEVGTPDKPAAGDPVKSSGTRTATPWSATGAFAMGRGLTNGALTDWWPGSIDNVRVFSDKVIAESKIRRLCQGAEASDFGGSQLALDPTTTTGQ